MLRAAGWQAAIDYPIRAQKASPVAFLSPNDPPFIVFHYEEEEIDVRVAKWFDEDVKAMGRKDQTIIVSGNAHTIEL